MLNPDDIAEAEAAESRVEVEVAYGTQVIDSSLTESNSKNRSIRYIGLTKAELDKYEKDPFWSELRLILFTASWALWFGMLLAVIVIIIVSQKCPPRPDRQFWQSPHYRLQLRSFAPDPKFANNASVAGSISGLESRLDYLLKNLGVRNFILGDVVETEVSSGCSSDFSKLSSTVGTVEQLAAMTKRGRKKGYNFMIEMDLSQADHEFSNSSTVVLADAFRMSAGNFTVKSRVGANMAWRANQLHAFCDSCNSINFQSNSVFNHVKDQLRVWLDRGVSGFLLSNAAYLQPRKTNVQDKVLFSEEGTIFVRKLREFIDTESDSRGRELALFVDAGNTGNHDDVEKLKKFATVGMAHAVINVGLGVLLKDGKKSTNLLKTLNESVNFDSFSSVSNWPYLRREADDLGLAAVGLTLPGVPIVYYGQELGMGHVDGVFASPKRSCLGDAEAEDMSQTPMQWANSNSAGWLSDASATLSWMSGMDRRKDDILKKNLRRLNSAGHPSSALHLTRQILSLIGEAESLQWGGAELTKDSTEKRIIIKRKAVRFPTVVVVVNRDNVGHAVSMSQPKSGRLRVMHNASASSYKLNETYKLDSLFVPAGSVLIFVGDDLD